MASTNGETSNNHAAFIWSVADLLRGDYKQSQYQQVILPFTVLRRFDCVLAPVKQEMLAKHKELKPKVENFASFLDDLTDIDGLWNISEFDFSRLLDDHENLADNLRAYIAGFSPEIREILEKFELEAQISKLDSSDLLYVVTSKFAEIDLHPETVSNIEMGHLYEELIRKFSELSNETAGEHFTPREVVRLMVDLLFSEDGSRLAKPGIKTTLYDPACGTGGMLSVAEDRLRELNSGVSLTVFGQELNEETYAVCRSEMMLKGQDASKIVSGNSFSEDGHVRKRFDYLLSNPPLGVGWKNVEPLVRDEHESLGFAGRFGAGLPRINDGSFLFLQHMIKKMKTPEEGGARLAIVFNGPQLVTGRAGSGESEIRRWIIENDWLETVVALPDQLFYNAGRATYIWIITNRKAKNRKGKVQLIDARESFTKMRKSLGNKRKEISDAQIDEIVRLHGKAHSRANENEFASSIVSSNEKFGFLHITVERPLRMRWAITEDAVSALEADKRLAKLDDAHRTGLVGVLRSRLGHKYNNEDEVRSDAIIWMASAGLEGRPIEKSIVDAISEVDPGSPVVSHKDGLWADPDLSTTENVPLPGQLVGFEADPSERLETKAFRAAVDAYVEAEVHPYVSDAWVDYSKTKIGYGIPAWKFMRDIDLQTHRPLSRLVEFVSPSKQDDNFPLLTSGELRQGCESADGLPRGVDSRGRPLVTCIGGDLVGRGHEWHLLPQAFGSAATDLTVLRREHDSEVDFSLLRLWLGGPECQSQQIRAMWSRLDRDTMVPHDFVTSTALAEAVDYLRKARGEAEVVLNAVFVDPLIENDLGELEPSKLIMAAATMRGVKSLLESLADVVHRAEMQYPYQIAKLARDYRLAAAGESNQLDASVLLAEALLRSVGLVAAAVLLKASDEHRENVLKEFVGGLSTGSWLTIIKSGQKSGALVGYPEIEAISFKKHGLGVLLERSIEIRNKIGHKQGPLPLDQERSFRAELSDLLFDALDRMTWLGHYEYLQARACVFENGHHELHAVRLNGSHPDWEPVAVPLREPLEPNQLYLKTPNTSTLLELGPLASVEECSKCLRSELYLLQRIKSNGMGSALSLKGHEIDVQVKK